VDDMCVHLDRPRALDEFVDPPQGGVAGQVAQVVQQVRPLLWGTTS
jgi:hypothetical protein